ETPDTFRRWYESIDYTNTRIKVNEPRNVSLNYYNPLLISAVLGDIAALSFQIFLYFLKFLYSS
ncbi:MAG: hypothetical protein SOW32_05475, partial [Agathobacter sp.]|nr:hypothetical protein [Agathobacter sp.]